MAKKWVKKGTATPGWRLTGKSRTVQKIKRTVTTVLRNKGLNPELKVKQASLVAFATNNTLGTFIILNNPTIAGSLDRGTLQTQRVGDKVGIKRISCRFSIQNTALVTDAAFRVMMIYDKDANGVTPAASDIFGLAGVAGRTIHFDYDPYTVPSQYKVLYDRTIDQRLYIAGPPAFDSGPRTFNINKIFKTPMKTVYYKAATVGSQADIEQGAFYLFVVSGPPGVTTNVSIMEIRVYFTDV